MNTKRFIIIVLAIFTPYFIIAQSTTSTLFDKYEGNEGFTRIRVSGDLFKMMSNKSVKISNSKINTSNFDFSQIKNLIILNFEGDFFAKWDYNSIINDIKQALNNNKLKKEKLIEMSIGLEAFDIFLYGDKTEIKEVIMLRNNKKEKEVSLIIFEGLFKKEMINNIVKGTMEGVVDKEAK